MSGYVFDEEINELTEEYTAQKIANDDLQYLSLANLRFLQGKRAYSEGSYHLAFSLFRECVDALVQNLNVVLSFSTNTREAIVAKAKMFLVDRAKYLVFAFILDSSIGRQSSDLGQLKRALLRSDELHITSYRLGRKTSESILEDGIVLTIGRHPEKFVNILTDDAFFDQIDSADISKHRRMIIKKGYLANKLRNLEYNSYSSREQTSRERAKCHKEIAKIILEEGDPEDLYAYYDHHIDYLRFSCTSTKSLDVFWRRYQRLQSGLDEMESYYNSSAGSIKKAHLETAFCLIHGMGIAKELDEREEIARLVSINYTYVRSHNAERFRVYWDWFRLARKILRRTSVTSKMLQETIDYATSLRSANYIDIDEEFLRKTLPEVRLTADNITTVIEYLRALSDSSYLTPVQMPKVLEAALNLYIAGLLDLASAYQILRKHIEVDLKINLSPEPLKLSDGPMPAQLNPHAEQIRNGESDEVEFKQTWRYNITTSSSSREVENSAIKAIAAFLNSKGGTLFVGIDDNGNLVGLQDTEFRLYGKKNAIDEFKRQVDAAFSASLGNVYIHLINIEFSTHEEKIFAIIRVKPSPSPIFHRNTLYIRANASSREIIGPELLAYCHERFKQI